MPEEKMTEIFVKVVKDDGAEEYQPLDWSKTEIPEDVVKSTPTYKGVLDESVKRRQTIQKLKEQVETLSKEGEPQPQDPQPEPAPSSDGLFKTRDELLNFIQTELSQRDSEKAKAHRAKEAEMLELVNKHKLNTDAVPLLMKAENPEELAQYMGQQKLRFDDVSGGEQKQPASLEDIVGRVAEKLNLTKK